MTTAGEIDNKWFIIDAEGQILGRLASAIAHRLRGKHKPSYTPHMNDGDFIIVINAEKIAVTGKKMTDKKYYRHTGYPGGIREKSLSEMLDNTPIKVVEKAVKGMLPKGPLGNSMYRKLNVYAGAEHPHQAQQPESFTLSNEKEA